MPITYLELENFKSYAGIQRIGPFKDFTSVIGPNGSGKSNLMDSISFILGVKSRHLRSAQLRDLIFRPPGEEATSEENQIRKASATLVYQDAETQVETRYSRTISARGVGEYQIDGTTVTYANYEKALSNIGVLLKGRNFLVFQGDVETTAQKSPKDLVEWFEEISNSAEFKPQYEEALKIMQEADASARSASEAQKGFREKKRQLRSEKDEAEKFKNLVEERRRLHTEFFLWKLFHVKKDIEEKEEDLDESKAEMEETKNELENQAKMVRKAKKERSVASNATVKCEKKRVQLASEVDQVQPSIIKSQEEIKNINKKLASGKRKLANIEKDSNAHSQTLTNLEKEIQEYTETESGLQQEYEALKRDGTGDVTLTEDQEAEYEQLRVAAAVSSAKYRQALDVVKSRLGTTKNVSTRTVEELNDLKENKKEVMQRMNDYIERKNKLETVSRHSH